MADEDSDDSSKTEEPSHRKLEEAHKKGQTVSSREINHFFIIGALTVFIMGFGAYSAHQTLDLLEPFVTQPEMYEISGAGLQGILRQIAMGGGAILAIPLLLTFLAAIAPAVVQKKWVLSAESIKPKLSNISPLSGFNRLFGMKALIEFIKNLLKISLVMVAIVWVVIPYTNEFAALPRLQKTEMLAFAKTIASKILIAVLVILFLLSIFDYIYQRFIFMKRMRMTKQEVRDEYRQQEGDPMVKNKLRMIRREKARRRMMANVPKADVVVTNPTHFAVALQYDADTMSAPKLVAKGADEVAHRIRDLAIKSKVPIVRNPPLARVLYDTAELDEEIPMEHYQAVAKVIGYVYKLRGKVPKKQKAEPMFGKTLNPFAKKKK